MSEAFAEFPKVAARPVAELLRVIGEFVDFLAQADPDVPAINHVGPSVVGWHSWHIASEWGIHAADTAAALGKDRAVPTEHGVDALLWTLQYVFPMIWQFRSLTPPSPVSFVSADGGIDITVPDGEPVARVEGGAWDVSMHLWRRPHGPIELSGDTLVLRGWTDLSIGR